MFRIRIGFCGVLLALLISACQPPNPPTPIITTLKIEAATTSLQAGSSLNLRALIQGNTLALEGGVTWALDQGIGTLSATSGQEIVYLAPSRLLQPTAVQISVTSNLDPSKSDSLELTLQPVVTSIRLTASSLNLLSNQTSTITASIEGSGNTDLEWQIVTGAGELERLSSIQQIYTAPVVRQTRATQIRVISRLDPSQTATLSLIVRPNNQTIASSNSFGLAVHQNGALWAWGSNLPNLVSPSPPQALLAENVGAFTNAKAVVAGALHALVLGQTGSVWGFGLNDDWQLGTNQNNNTPQKVPLGDIVQVACGEGHSLALRAAGLVWSWGRNSEGQLGVGTAPKQLPTQILGLTNVVQISAGQFFSLALLENGQVWGWGENTHGQLGASNAGQNVRQPQQVLGLSQIVQITSGRDFALAVNSAGQVLAWGNNQFGQLGDGSKIARSSPVRLALEQIQSVQAGLDHSLALRRNGAVFAWGNNQLGQVGNRGDVLQPTPSSLGVVAVGIHASQHNSAAITASGTVLMWGQNRFGQITLPVSSLQDLPLQVFTEAHLP
jgi:alpha-tubulin suppressor-like RCC1 family protein